MSAKKRSFLCKIVHKLTENARFFAQKRHFLHIFAGGRDDFLAGQTWAFSGVAASRRRPRPRQDFASKILPRRTTFLHRCKNIKSLVKEVDEESFGKCVYHTHC